MKYFLDILHLKYFILTIIRKLLFQNFFLNYLNFHLVKLRYQQVILILKKRLKFFLNT
jgi:hypothetical protein